jgi:hypothetical protein
MSGFIITVDATLACPHQSGTARALAADPHVAVKGSAIMTVQRQYIIDHCPDSSTSHCLKASWEVGAQRVTASGLAVAIHSGVSKVDPAGMLTPQLFQTTVAAS